MTLRGERADLATLLQTELTGEDGPTFPVEPFLPERTSVPAGFIIPGSPYLEDGLTFGSYLVRFEAHLLFNAVGNEKASNDLDDTVETAVVAAANAGWSVESVSEPFQVTVAGATYLAVQLQVTRAIAL